jgi:uncharacterized protein (DUF934 family)
MDNLNFSENTIAVNEWYQLDKEFENDENQARVLVVAADSALEFLDGPLDRLERIVITSTDFNDGRFFSIGRQIRLRGYSGRLTVVGNILPDQYTALRFCGFDDVLILDNSANSRVVSLDKAFALPGVEDSLTRNPEHRTATGNRQWPKFIKKG